MAFMRGWSATLGKWIGLQLDANNRLEVSKPPTKTIQPEIVSVTAVSADAVHKSSPVDVSKHSNVFLMIDHGRIADGAFVTEATEYLVQISQQSSGDDTWRTLTSVACSLDDPLAMTPDTAADVAAGSQDNIPLQAAVTGLTLGDSVFFYKSATPAESEWAKVKAFTDNAASSVISLLDPLRYDQDGSVLYNKAEHFVLSMSVDAATRLRVVCNNARTGTNQNVAYRAALITAV